MTADLVFLKLGGSLITNKSCPNKALPGRISDLANAIKIVTEKYPGKRMILGHGSGSFGHHAAYKYATQDGVRTQAEWIGFLEVWRAAQALHRIVISQLIEVNLPVMSFPPSSMITTEDKRITNWNLEPIASSLFNGFIPVIYGDVVFDKALGGTILSTEDLFVYLAERMMPKSILIAGMEEGVYSDYPACNSVIPNLSPGNINEYNETLNSSGSVDVTGGMRSKVLLMLNLVKNDPSLRIHIFSGKDPNNIIRIMDGEHIGTPISAS
jgi:isopentenyl phosphate kinase